MYNNENKYECIGEKASHMAAAGAFNGALNPPVQQGPPPSVTGGLLPAAGRCLTSVASGTKLAYEGLSKVAVFIVLIAAAVMLWRWWRSRRAQRAVKQLSLQDRVQRIEATLVQLLSSGSVQARGVLEDRMGVLEQSPGWSMHSHLDSGFLRKIHTDPSDTDKVTMPRSGRFYDANEFHAVGVISQVKGVSGSQGAEAGVPASLPLYGQRIPDVGGNNQIRSRWQYTTVLNNKQYSVARITSFQPPIIEDCSQATGCDEFPQDKDTGVLLVAVPQLSGGVPWRVRLYSRV